MSKKRLSTGIDGLDQIIFGGLIPKRSYLIRGGPGTGKTTFGFHFLEKGIKADEEVLFISLTESKNKLILDAKKRGFSIDQINFFDMSPNSNFFKENQDYDIFPPDQVEEEKYTKKILKKIKKIKPQRIFFDGIAQLKYLSSDQFRYRKKTLSFLKLASNLGATILLSSEVNENTGDNDLQFLVDGVINLEFEKNRRYLSVSKFRGSDFQAGKHAMKLKDKGAFVYPVLRTLKTKENQKATKLSSGVTEVDALLYGGIEAGTTTVITGPSGVGKTTLSMQFMKAASRRGERSVVYTFEENHRILLKRSESINIPLKKMQKKDNLQIHKINPLDYSPDEFTYKVRKEVEKKDAKIILIDSLAGYKLSFGQSGTNKIIESLHALSDYLTNRGITVFIINEVQNITGDFKATDFGISYMADNIIFLRYIETRGKLRKAIGVLKKRLSNFEKTLREFKITKYGIKVGEPLINLRGILTGNPEFIDEIDKGEI